MGEGLNYMRKNIEVKRVRISKEEEGKKDMLEMDEDDEEENEEEEEAVDLSSDLEEIGEDDDSEDVKEEDEEEAKADIEFLMSEEPPEDQTVEVSEEVPGIKEEEEDGKGLVWFDPDAKEDEDEDIKEEDEEEEIPHEKEVQEATLAKEKTESGWETIASLPAGWKFREITGPGSNPGKRQFIRSPTGKMFPCRRLALKYLIENGFPEGEVASMRDMLAHEKWQGHSLLPEGWLYREDLTYVNSQEFISKERLLLKTFKTAMAHVKESKGIPQREIDKFELFNAGEKQKTKLSFDWKEDLSLPAGWKSKGGVNCKYFLSPQGDRQFSGRRLALQYMIQKGHSEQDKRKMREGMDQEGWQTSQLLPQGWILKEYESRGKNSTFLLTREGHLFKSCKNAVDYLKLNSQYDDQDIENVLKIYKDVSNKQRKNEVNWVQSETLPEGWKIRIPPGSSEKKFFLSPDGQSFSSRRLALQFMIQSNCSQDEIEQMRKSMEEDGWKTSDNLPEDWIYKVLITSSKQYSVNISILSDQAVRFESYLAAIKFMENSDFYGKEDIDGVNKLLVENTKDWRKSIFLSEPAKADHPLPPGWKLRQCGSRNMLVSPQGQQFPTRKKALQHMIQNEYSDDEEVEMMRVSMQDEGWRSSDCLPQQWLYRAGQGERRKDAITILADTGEQFNSYLAAIKYMEGCLEFGDEDIRKVNQLLSEIKGKLGGDTVVKQETSFLPQGWKIRTLGQLNFVISPEGEQFKNKRKALESMAKNGAPEEDKDGMRKSMIEEEGWRQSEHLPKSWMFKYLNSATNGTKVDIVSDDGLLFNSYVSAIKFMGASPLYTDEDERKMNVLSEENTKNSRISGERQYIKMEPEDPVAALVTPEGWKACVVGKHRLVSLR